MNATVAEAGKLTKKLYIAHITELPSLPSLPIAFNFHVGAHVVIQFLNKKTIDAMHQRSPLKKVEEEI